VTGDTKGEKRAGRGGFDGEPDDAFAESPFDACANICPYSKVADSPVSVGGIRGGTEEILMSGKVSALFAASVMLSFLAGLGPVGGAQDISTSDGAFGESGAFVFRRRPPKRQGTANSTARRNPSQIAEERRRVTEQSRKVDRDSPKRGRSDEVDPNKVNLGSAEIRRKSKEEVSVIFAGVGEFYLRELDLPSAVQFFREAVELDPRNEKASFGLSEALTRQADALLDKEQLRLAKPVYEEAVGFNPRNAAAHAGLGGIALAGGDAKEAIRLYAKAVELDPDLSEVLTPLGILYLEAGEVALADEALSRAVLARTEEADAQLYLGLVRYRQNRNEEALAAIRKATELDPESATAWYSLGEVLSRLERRAEAEAAYRAAIRIKDDYLDAWYDLGLVLVELGKSDDAIEAFRRVVRLKVDFGEAYVNLGDLYRKVNKIDQAISAYRLATTFIVDDAELFSRFALASAIRALEPGYSSYWILAIENLRKAVALQPDATDYSNLGWALYNAGVIDSKSGDPAAAKARFAEAKEVLRKAIELNPGFAPAHLNLGMTLGDDGENEEAIQVLRTAVRLKKDWVQAHNELGLALVRGKLLSDAVKEFKRAVEIDDNFAVGYYNLAETEIRLGKMKDAKKSYERLKKLGRNDLVLRLEAITGGQIAK